MRAKTTLLLAVIIVFGPISARAQEAWVVRSLAFGQPTERESCSILWADRMSFHNSSAQRETVRLLGVSNGVSRTSPQALDLPPGKTTEVRSGPLNDLLGWQSGTPSGFAPLSVAHLEVPEGIVIADRIEIVEFCLGSQPPGSPRALRGSIPMQVLRSLVPPGRPQIHLGVDVGYKEGFVTTASRINVGVYNAAISPGNAIIEIRRACDDVLVERRTATVPPNTIQQFGGFSNPGPPETACFETYVVVTLDQPGFSYAVAVSNETLPVMSVGVGGGT